MIQSVRSRRKARAGVDIPLAPLIDMVFILLIFFLVTTTFVRETGLRVRRPRAKTAQVLDAKNLLVGVDPQGRIHVEGRRVDLLSLRSVVERRVRSRPDLSVVLVVDEATPTGTLVRVMDECREAGAKRIAVASRKE